MNELSSVHQVLPREWSGLGGYPGFAVGERDVSSRRVMIWQADVESSVV